MYVYMYIYMCVTIYAMNNNSLQPSGTVNWKNVTLTNSDRQIYGAPPAFWCKTSEVPA